MNVGRALAAAVAGFFLFFFLALDLVLFGVIPLGSLLVTVLPPFGFVLGAIVGSFVPKPGSGGAVANWFSSLMQKQTLRLKPWRLMK